MKSQDRVVPAWCDPGSVDGAFAADMMHLGRARDWRLGPLLRVHGSGLLSRIRNELVATFLDRSDAEWLWMVDTDHRIPVEAFDRLVTFCERLRAAGALIHAHTGAVLPHRKSFWQTDAHHSAWRSAHD